MRASERLKLRRLAVGAFFEGGGDDCEFVTEQYQLGEDPLAKFLWKSLENTRSPEEAVDTLDCFMADLAGAEAAIIRHYKLPLRQRRLVGHKQK